MEGEIHGFRVRCLSWEAMYYEFLGYLDELPKEEWLEKHLASYEIIKSILTPENQKNLDRSHSLWKQRLLSND